MSGPALISVVIPCYNCERYIAATLRSVLAQDWPKLELIVVDDGSSDGSAELVRREFPQVRLVEQANQGVAAARNLGVAQARGEWVAFVDADDIWLPGKLRAQMEQLARQPDCRLGYTAWQVWHSDDPEPSAAYLEQLQAEAADAARWRGPGGWIYAELLLDCEVWTSTVLMQRRLFEELGGFDAGLRIGEDYDLWLRASRLTTIQRLDRPYALYRKHPHSITRALPRENYRGLVVERALGRWGLDAPDGRRADKPAVMAALAKSWSDFAGSHLQAGDLGQARHGAGMALRRDPTHLPGWKVLIKALVLSLAGRPRQPASRK